MNKVIWIIILIIVLVGIYWAMNSGTPAPAPATTTDTQQTTTNTTTTTAPVASIAAGDQAAGKVVMVSSVVLPVDGFIVVHKELNGAPGAVIGTLALKAGSYTNQSIPLTEAIKAGQNVYPMLHPDVKGDGKYSADAEGTPITDASGAPVMMKVTVK